MEIKHVPALPSKFAHARPLRSHACHFKNFMARGSQGFVRQSSPIHVTRVEQVEQPSVLSKFFFPNYNILSRSGVRAESLRAGSQNMPNFVTFWPTL